MHFMANNQAAPAYLSVSLPQSTAGFPVATPVQMPRRSSDPLCRSSYMASEMKDPSPSAVRGSMVTDDLYEMPAVKGQRLMVLAKAIMRLNESIVDADSPYLTDLLPGDVCYFLEAGAKNRIKVQTHDREGWVTWKTAKVQILSIHAKEV